MSEFAPSGVSVHAAQRPAQALTPEAIDTLLADFRRWLEQLAVPSADGATPPPPPAEAVDLHTLLGQFLAVRHEVNSQTKAVRAQQELNAETLHELSTALDALEGAQGRHQEYQASERDRYERGRQGVDRVRQLLSSLVTGYRMGLQRVERALAQQGLEPILATGTPFDPERMEVLEAVANTGRPPGEVIEEVRRGYLWRGRVFRFAQVRVA